MAAALWACRRWFAHRPALRQRLDATLRDIYRVCGLKARLAGPLAGWLLVGRLRQEDARLRAGWTYEPPTFYEKNDAALAAAGSVTAVSTLAAWAQSKSGQMADPVAGG
jgi:hypothetical protein